jgi:hypothetical protein
MGYLMTSVKKAGAKKTGVKKGLVASFEVVANQGYTEFDGPQAYEGFPARVSLPMAQGEWKGDEALVVKDGKGKPVTAVVRPFLRWPDGSVRVWEVWLSVNMKRGERATYGLHLAKTAGAKVAGAGAFGPKACEVVLTLGDGRMLKTTVSLEGGKDALGVVNREFAFTLREGQGEPMFEGAIVQRLWSWYAGTEWEVRVTNLHGNDDTTDVKGLRLNFELPGELAADPKYLVRQTSFTASGHPCLTERPNVIDIKARGFVHAPDASQLGEDESRYPAYERGGYVLALAPWVAVKDKDQAWVLVMPEAVERMPKGWKIEGKKVSVDLHPADSPMLQWRQGMTLYQRIVLAKLPVSGAGSAENAQIESAAQAWLRPAILTVEAKAYRAAGWRIPFVYEPEKYPRTEFKYRDSFNFGWNYGTFDYGDQIAGSKGGGAVTPGSKGVSRNLEYDFPAVAAKDFARTGVYHMYRMCQDSARHMMYTDFVAKSTDQWKQGGIVHHSTDHTSGSAYPSHMWAEGMVLYYQLSGDAYARSVFERVGDFYNKYINERFSTVQSTAREVGWLLIAMSAVYDVTRDEKYLDGIKKVVDFNLDQGRKKFFPTDACFTIGVAIIGLDRSREFHRNKETKKFILDLLDWMIEERSDGIGLFEYWKDPEKGAIPYIQTHFPEAMNIGYLISGDEKYLKSAWRNYMMHLDGALLTVENRAREPECGYAAGNYISWQGCLASFAKKGWLGKVQYPEPW